MLYNIPATVVDPDLLDGLHSCFHMIDLHQAFITLIAPFDFHHFCFPFLPDFLFSVSPGLDERDAAFMRRLRNLAHEALTWPHLGERQRLVWAAALELEAVPFQEQLGVSNDGKPGR